jgi:hypothetical protein
MPSKRVLRPERLRRVPAQFSWVDQRLVRDGHIEHCDAPALALYLFLVTVGDAQGLSYYGEASIARRLSLDPAAVVRARQTLIEAGLIAYQAPLYQVLALEEAPRAAARVHRTAPGAAAPRPTAPADRAQARAHLRRLREVVQVRRHD